MSNGDGNNSLMRYVGFDSDGEVFLSGNRILRGIYPGKGAFYRNVLRRCEEDDLFCFGLVKTWEAQENPCPELTHDLVLEHERIPFVSYPHEWSASMLKDAALFHIDLYEHLGNYGLTIKDWHPYNILFKGTEPIFVDFTSIIPTESLLDEPYLTPPQVPLLFKFAWDQYAAYFYEMYCRMCLPYFLLPLYMMSLRRYETARRRVFETTLNASQATITAQEIYTTAPSFTSKMAFFLFKLAHHAKKIALLQRGQRKHWFFEVVRQEIQKLSVSPHKSGYSDYYAAKNETFEFHPSAAWTPKQRVIYETITTFQPKTVLDIGSNTGWFALLAAKCGSQVVAIDTDEACIDALYHHAQEKRLPILPVVMDITRLTPDVPPIHYDNEPDRSLLGGRFPLLLAAEKRLACEMTFALALIHHLALGQGKQFSEILCTLNALTQKYLVVEFVAKEDALIVAEPDFFPAWEKAPHQFEWYTLDVFLQEAGRYFTNIRIQESSAASRTILVCEKG